MTATCRPRSRGPVAAGAATAAILTTIAFAAPAPAGAAPPTTTAEPVTLRMATPFGPETAPLGPFRTSLDDLSGGTVQVQEVEGLPGETEEQQIIAAVASGDLDLGWVGTRAFAELEMHSFDALTAPLLIDSYELEQAVLDSDIPERMLPGVEQLDLVGLAVIGGGLRKPFAVDGPLFGPDDYQGITFRTWHSAGHAEAISALGATHTDESSVGAGVAAGMIQAIENVLAWYEPIDARQTPHITSNVNLWPQMMVLVANPETVAALGDEQAGWLQEAATDVAGGWFEFANVDAELLDEICSWGARFHEASDADLAALREAVQPVYDALAEDADTATYLAEIEAIKGSVVAEPLVIPEGCTGEAPDVAVEGADDPGVLNGTYQLEWTVDELVAAGVPEDVVHQFELAGHFTNRFDNGDFTWQFRDEPDAEPNLECGGTYGVTGDVVNIHRQPPCIEWIFTATWALTDEELVYSDTLLDGEHNPVLAVWLAGKPWERID